MRREKGRLCAWSDCGPHTQHSTLLLAHTHTHADTDTHIITTLLPLMWREGGRHTCTHTESRPHLGMVRCRISALRQGSCVLLSAGLLFLLHTMVCLVLLAGAESREGCCMLWTLAGALACGTAVWRDVCGEA